MWCTPTVLRPRVPRHLLLRSYRLHVTMTQHANMAQPPRGKRPELKVAWEGRVPVLEGPLRLDQALLQLYGQHFTSLSLSKRSIRRLEVLVDGVQGRTTTEVRGGELLQWLQRASAHQPDPRRIAPLPALPGNQPLQVIFDDDHLACVVKPQGLPMAGNRSGSGKACLEHYLSQALVPSQALGAMRQPHHVHRLDEPTGGLVLVGKSWPAMRALGEAFKGRGVQKRYRALAWGRLEGRGLVRFTLSGKPSETEYVAVGHYRVQRCGGSGICSSRGGGGDVAGSGGESESESAQEGEGAEVGSTHGGYGSTYSGSQEATAAMHEDRPASCGGSSSDGGSGGGGGSALEAGAALQQGEVGSSAGGGSCGGCWCPEWVTTVDLYPHTGRTHQLRRHMALIGHPLVGDSKYTHGYAKQRFEAGVDMPPEGHVRLGLGEMDRQGTAPQQQREQPGASAALPVWAAAGAQGKQEQQPSREGVAAAIAPDPGDACISSPVLCLWAVQLDLKHPVTGVPLHLEILEPAVLGRVRDALGAAA